MYHVKENNNIVYESEECNYDLDTIILETLSDDIDYVYQWICFIQFCHDFMRI